MLSSVVIPSFNVSDVCSLFFIQYANLFFMATVSSLINFSTPLLGSRGGVAKTALTIIAQVEIPASTPYLVSLCCCRFSPLLREVFHWALQFRVL